MCDVKRPRILVRLNADEGDKPVITVAPEAGEQRGHVDSRIGLVNDIDGDVHVRTEHLALDAIGCNAVHRGERVRGNHRAPPTDDVAVIVIVRRLDQDELKEPLCRHGRSCFSGVDYRAWSTSGEGKHPRQVEGHGSELRLTA
jgi:hypothetical protein